MKKIYLLSFLFLWSFHFTSIQAHHSFIVDFIPTSIERNTPKSTIDKKKKLKKIHRKYKKPKTKREGLKRHPLAILGLILSVYFVAWAIKTIFFPFVGYIIKRSFLFILGSYLSAFSGLFGVTAGLVAISRIKKFPEKFRGRKMAKVAWLIGAIASFLALLFLFI